MNSVINKTAKARTLAPLVPTNGAPFFAYLIFLFLVIRPLLLLGDGGTCRHVLTGQYILHNHSIPTTNYVFAINPFAPWITHELLADVILGGAQDLFGLNGVVLLSAMAISLALTWSYQFARLRGIGVISGLILLIIAMTATSIHWSARAHIFSYLPFLIVYFAVFVSDLAPKIRYPLLIFTMAAWSNLHGSFLLGLMMIGCKLAENIFALVLAKIKTRAIDVSRTTNLLKLRFFFFLAAITGASFNIRGLVFLKYVCDYASNPMIRFHNQESRSIDLSAGLPIYAFLVLMSISILIMRYSRKPPKFSELLLFSGLFVGGLYSMRIVPYFALIALPSIAGSWAVLKERIFVNGGSSANKLLQYLASFCKLEDKLDQQESTSIRNYLGAYALFGACIVLWLFIPFFKISDYDPERLPVEGTSWLINNKVEGLGFNPDNWGDYLYWRRGKPVFIDDKGDFYSPDFDREYIAVYTASDEWKSILDKYKVKWLILPNSLPLIPILSRDPNWRATHRDKLVSIYIRD